jgi:hypothetical protein
MEDKEKSNEREPGERLTRLYGGLLWFATEYIADKLGHEDQEKLAELLVSGGVEVRDNHEKLAEWVEEFKAFLLAHGVEEDQITEDKLIEYDRIAEEEDAEIFASDDEDTSEEAVKAKVGKLIDKARRRSDTTH